MMSSYLVNETLVVDAGCIGLMGDIDAQARIRSVLISHLHMDHIASLPILIENAFETGRGGPTILGSRHVIDGLKAHIFNDVIWPDLARLSLGPNPFVRFQALEPGAAIDCEGLRVTPIPVDHLVPTLGFILSGEGGSVAIPSDTGPTEAFWQAANAITDLRAVFLEAAFPNDMAWLANVSQHLTPALLAGEVAKLDSKPRIIAVHIKPRYHHEVVAELMALGLPNLEIGVPGKTYDFSAGAER